MSKFNNQLVTGLVAISIVMLSATGQALTVDDDLEVVIISGESSEDVSNNITDFSDLLSDETSTQEETIPDLPGPIVNPGTGAEETVTDGTPSAVPEPATMLLLGSGLVALAGRARKQQCE